MPQQSPTREPGALTTLLVSFRDGDRGALDDIFRLVLPELHRVARHLLFTEQSAQTLQPTALINESYLRMFDGAPAHWENSRHFVASAVLEMRRVLVDHARKSNSQKRNRNESVAVPDAIAANMRGDDPEFLIDLDRALTVLGQMSSRAASVVEMTVFGGLTREEIAAVLGVSYRTVEREWRWSRAWLRRYLYSTEE